MSLGVLQWGLNGFCGAKWSFVNRSGVRAVLRVQGLGVRAFRACRVSVLLLVCLVVFGFCLYLGILC